MIFSHYFSSIAFVTNTTMKTRPIFSYDVHVIGMAGSRQLFWECNECVLGTLKI